MNLSKSLKLSSYRRPTEIPKRCITVKGQPKYPKTVLRKKGVCKEVILILIILKRLIPNLSTYNVHNLQLKSFFQLLYILAKNVKNFHLGVKTCL